MRSRAPSTTRPWVETPCVRSTALSQAAGCNIYLKLETLQPSHSFKSRGVGNLISKAIPSHSSSKPRFYSSSGGNAGLACATAALALECPATIVVPVSTNELMIGKLKMRGAEVVQRGAHWSEADAFLRGLMRERGDEGVYVHPFDHEDIWEGHATMIGELEGQMRGVGGYDALVTSVGGGGLLVGLMKGLEKAGRLGKGTASVKVMAVETQGADSLAQSLKAGELVKLPAITSIATSLGAVQVCQAAFDYGRSDAVTSLVLSDAEAAMGCVHFADDERILVEAACGVSIATVYNGALRETLFPHLTDPEYQKLNIVIVVCGGSNITLQMLENYKAKYANDETVLRKFRQRGISSLKQEYKSDGLVGEDTLVPNIGQSRAEHETVVVPECVGTIAHAPVIATVEKTDVERQIGDCGTVADVNVER